MPVLIHMSIEEYKKVQADENLKIIARLILGFRSSISTDVGIYTLVLL
jgi:hypothetical protein